MNAPLPAGEQPSAFSKLLDLAKKPFLALTGLFSTTRKNNANSATAAGTPSNATKVKVEYPVPPNAVAVNVEGKPSAAPPQLGSQPLSVGGRRHKRKATKKQRKH